MWQQRKKGSRLKARSLLGNTAPCVHVPAGAVAGISRGLEAKAQAPAGGSHSAEPRAAATGGEEHGQSPVGNEHPRPESPRVL